MSEKVTFRELIDAIAEETENSKQFTHDFLKDFVEVINNGLEQEGNVNIAGFGKFNLKKVDERDGYNPQTEEKITIPAHNKIVFKPYKDLRELVNAPYAHLESELIEPEENTQGDAQKDESTPTENIGEDDFIPTAPPTSHDTLDQEDSQKGQLNNENDEEDPFGLGETASQTSSSFFFEENETTPNEDEEDIVEYNNHAADEEDHDDDLEDFFDLEESNPEDTREQTDQDSETSFKEAEQESRESTEASDEIISEKTEEETKISLSSSQDTKSDTKPSENEDKGDREAQAQTAEKPEKKSLTEKDDPSYKKTSPFPLVATAIVLLVLVAGTAWYLGFFSENNSTSNISNSTIAKANMSGQKTHSHPRDSQQPAVRQKNKQKKQQKNVSGSGATHKSPKKNKEITIAKGQTLWSIAHREYDNPRLWPWIYDHNKTLNNPNIIIAGNSLLVPLPSGPQYGLTSNDSVEVAKGYIATYKWYKDKGSERARNYLWAAKKYHSDIRDITSVKIDKDDLAFANQVR